MISNFELLVRMCARDTTFHIPIHDWERLGTIGNDCERLG